MKSLFLFLPMMAIAAANPNQLRMAKEARKLAIEAGLLNGICTVELIRPDMLSVTLDGGIVGLLDDRTDAEYAQAVGGSAADLQKPEAFVVSSSTDPAFAEGTLPKAVGRTSYEWHNCMDAKNRWPLYVNRIHRHDYYLALPRPLKQGHRYTIRVVRPAPDARFAHEATFRYDRTTTSKVLKINQVGYSSAASRRYAYLGWWAGSLGTVTYDAFNTFNVIDESTGRSVLTGRITLRAKGDKNSGENIHELDLSALKRGTYHIVVPDFARSDSFNVGGQAVFDLYYHTMRAFFHQRCGQELREPWTAFAKPACHTEIWESGEFVSESGSLNHSPGARNAHSGYQPRPGEKKMAMKGGYHDAADFDTFSYHLPATARILGAYEMVPGAFKDAQLNLPESGNGIPDILDEAEWGLSWYIDHQYKSGAVPMGRINKCDALKQNFEGGKQAPMPPYGIIPPRKDSTPTFAAVAAQFARCIRPFDAAKADRYQAASVKAWEYTTSRTALDSWKEFRTDAVPLLPPDEHRGKRVPGHGEDDWKRAAAWAAGELLLNTGDKRYNDYVAAQQKTLNYWHGNEYRFWAYLRCRPEVANTGVQDWMRSTLLTDRNWGADRKCAETEKAGYRMANGQGTACGWGGCQGANHGDTLLRAWYFTRDRKYLDAACLNADWHLGANPLSKTLITNMGQRHPNRPEISWFLYAKRENNDVRGPTVKGIGIYGIGPPLRSYPGTPKGAPNEQTWPLWRSWRDVWGNFAEIYSEFTVHQTVGPTAMLYATLYALEQDVGLIAQ